MISDAIEKETEDSRPDKLDVRLVSSDRYDRQEDAII